MEAIAQKTELSAERAEQKAIFKLLVSKLSRSAYFSEAVVEKLQGQLSKRGFPYTRNNVHQCIQRGTDDRFLEEALVAVNEEKFSCKINDLFPDYVPYRQRVLGLPA